MAVQEGSIVGPYRLVQRLGGGGAGAVYLAEQIATVNGVPAQVAIKVIAGNADDPTAQKIAHSMQVVGQLQHPHIIPLYDALTQNANLAVVTAFAAGGSLGDTLRASNGSGQPRLTLPLGTAIVARLVSQLAAALDATHAIGEAHGDLKPNNIFVRTSPSGKPLAAIGDFGQSLLMGAAATILSRPTASNEQTNWATTQLLFAAPEQLNGITTPASDQYGVAALAYFFLIGKPPIVANGDNSALLLHQIRQQPIALPSQFNNMLSPAVDATLVRALAKDPMQRFPSLAAFAQALRDALATQNATDITQQFSMLAGEENATASAGRAVSGVAGVHLVNMTGVSSDHDYRMAQQEAGIPDPAPGVNRRLTIIACAALLLTILACVFTGEALNASSVLPHINLGNQRGTANTSTVPTANPTQQAAANTAQHELQLATKQPPVFSDGLTNNSHNWPTDGKTLYFTGGGFHISTLSATSVVGTDTPSSQINLSNLVAQVTVRFANAQAGDFSGVRFFANTNNDGTHDYYCFLVSIEGRYAVWEHRGDGQPTWTYITGGYASALKTGLNQANTIAVLAIGTGSAPRALLFANGQYIITIALKQSNIATAGGSGLMVFNDGVEAVFTNFALYNANNVH